MLNHIDLLIKAHKLLLQKVKELSERDLDAYYYDRFLEANEKNLELEDTISKLRTELFMKNQELEKYKKSNP